MKPWRKSESAPEAVPSQAPKLKIVPGGPATETKREAEPSYRLIFSFLTIAAAVLAAVVYFSPGNPWRWQSLDGTFNSLESLYKSHGMEKFLERKAQLRKAVTATLNQGGKPAEVDLATNIAVYLFPDVLPDGNFEKGPAEQMWGESIRQIEASPHTAESRVLFEALRADIWNYELVDREDPKLSGPAVQVIQIYDAISAP